MYCSLISRLLHTQVTSNMHHSRVIKLISIASTLVIISSALVPEITYSSSRKTYRMKVGEVVKCVGAEDDLKLSRKINFRGKGFHRFINPIKTLNCTLLVELSSPVSSTSPAKKRNVVLSCPKDLSYAGNFLTVEKYRDTFRIGCGMDVYPL
jgi:hypothetical protein